MVNCALQKFRRKQQLHAVVNIETTSAHELGNEDIISQIGAKEVLKMVQQGMFISLIFALSGFIGCKKDNGLNTVITASTTQTTVGQTVSLQVTTSMNAVSWTVTPFTTAITQYSITDQKTNTVTFTQPGVYTVGVRARDIAFDAAHQKLDSCWHHGGGDHGTCMHGRDSSSVSIKVF